MPQLDKVVYIFEYVFVCFGLCLVIYIMLGLLPSILLNLYLRNRLSKPLFICKYLDNFALVNYKLSIKPIKENLSSRKSINNFIVFFKLSRDYSILLSRSVRICIAVFCNTVDSLVFLSLYLNENNDGG